MNEAVSRVLDSACRLWPPEQWQDVNVVIALSGGADSVALMLAIVELKKQAGGRGEFAAIHVNHQLRGAESDADADWCQQTCDELGVPLTVCLADTAGRAGQQGDGIEAAARTERYRLMTEIAETKGARYLAMAHTADDQVETVLMRILRGTGLRGLSGIPRLRQLTPSLTLVRPLLATSRADLEAMLAALDHNYRTDSSNFDESFTRNRIRHRLLPLLRQEYSEELDESLLHLAAQAEQTQRLLEGFTSELLAECGLKQRETEVTLALAALRDAPALLACETLRVLWRELELPEQAMTHQWWERLADLCFEPEVLNLPGNVRAEVIDDRLRLSW